MQEADQLLKESNYQQALEKYQLATTLDPDGEIVPRALYQMGLIAELNLKKNDLAELYYEELLKRGTASPERLEALKRVANLYVEENKELKKASQYYKELIDQKPEIKERDFLLFKKAQGEILQSAFAEARSDLDALIKQYPESTFVRSAKLVHAETYFLDGNSKLAEPALLEIAKEYPDTEQAVEADFLRGQCLESEQKWKEALKLYESLRKKYPNPQVLQERITALRKRISKSK